MINSLKVIKPYKAVGMFEWKDIPRFCVIAGENGSGKTALLELINSGSNNPSASSIRSPQLGALKGKVKYIPANFNPSDIGQNATSAEKQIADKSQQVVGQIKNETPLPQR